MGPARGGRDRARAAAARPPADVRRRLPGHVPGSRRQLHPVVPDCPGRREDHRVQPDHRHRRIRRRLRPVAVHWRHLRHGLRRGRKSPVRPGRRAARPVRGRRHGRGVRLRGPGAAYLRGQRRGDDRRLHPHPAGLARRRHRHCRLTRPELRHHLHHQAAAPRHRHRPHPLRGPVRGPHRRRRHAPLRGTAQHLGRATQPGRTAQPGPGAARPHHPPPPPPDAVRHRVPHPGAAPARAVRPRRIAGDLRRRAAPARVDHQPERTASGRPPDARRPRCRTSAPRRQPGRHPRRGRLQPAADPADRLPDPGDHHLGRLARRRQGTRRHHLAARLDPGHRPG